jgi:hypothetical protein
MVLSKHEMETLLRMSTRKCEICALRLFVLFAYLSTISVILTITKWQDVSEL